MTPLLTQRLSLLKDVMDLHMPVFPRTSLWYLLACKWSLAKQPLIGNYNPRLIFAQFYWLLYVTWCKITGQLSRNGLRLASIIALRPFLSKRNKAKKNKSSSRISPFHLYYFSRKKNKPFSWNPLIMMLKKKQTGRQCCPDKYKK